jgi:myo-inositol-hexaphosphate 3-phosphohydrolase
MDLMERAVKHALKPLLSLRENRRGRRVVSLDDAATEMQWLENVAEGNTPTGAHARTLLGLAQGDSRVVDTMFVFQHDETIQ